MGGLPSGTSSPTAGTAVEAMLLDVGQVPSLGDVGGTLSLDASSYAGPSFFPASDFPLVQEGSAVLNILYILRVLI